MHVHRYFVRSSSNVSTHQCNKQTLPKLTKPEHINVLFDATSSKVVETPT
jgi:hypothetical protein